MSTWSTFAPGCSVEISGAHWNVGIDDEGPRRARAFGRVRAHATALPHHGPSIPMPPGSDRAGPDIVLLGDNPLTRIEATKSIRAVIQWGRDFDRKALDHMLAQAEIKPVTAPSTGGFCDH